MRTSIPVENAPEPQLDRSAMNSSSKILRYLLGVLVTASCGFPRPADVGPDVAGGGDDVADVECQLTAIEPAIANTDDTITLEGTFVDPVTVNFPGETSVTATMLGSNRAQVTVPQSATEGNLTVTACGRTFGFVSFRRAPFAVGLKKFERNPDQTNGALWGVRLETARNSHTSVALGRHLYVLGGANSSGALKSIEHARVNADGSLGAFASVSGLTLVTARQAHTATTIGNHLYLIGGLGSNGALNSVEQATIAPDGSLGPFETLADVTLRTPRQGHTSVVVGNYLYILGGADTTVLNSVERAVINIDGSLGQFAIASDTRLATARRNHTAVVSRTYLYIIGGTRANGFLQDVERAVINSDGSVGVFAPVAGATLLAERSGHTTVVLGNFLYVLGGVRDGSLNGVERAPVTSDGSVGSFAAVSDTGFGAARHGHATAVAGSYLYVLGGTGNGSLDQVDRATINVSGALGSFAITPDITLNIARSFHITAVLGSYLYVLGGGRSTERAIISADGSLGQFAILPDTNFEINRYNPTSAVIGNYLYIFGGYDGSALGSPVLSSMERASINSDSSLGSFANISARALVTARHSHTAVVIGDSLYILGGYGSNYLDSVERANINTDGSLGSFFIVDGVTLATARYGHTSAVIGNYLYVVGGISATGTLDSVERASINPDGSLQPFAPVTDVTLRNPRFNHSAAVIGSYLYILGGGAFANVGIETFENTVERAALAADGSLGQFAKVTGGTLAIAHASHATTVIGSYLYILGGRTYGFATLNSVERAELDVDSASSSDAASRGAD